MGKTPKQLGLPGELPRIQGGAFPIWLENAPCCPIAVAGCYSGSSQDDHNLVSTTVRDYLNKILRNSAGGDTAGPSMSNPSMPIPNIPPRTESDWLPEPSEFTSRRWINENPIPKKS
ncbi:hypothetical protein LENED_000911 [Lentinula edodes]|uniref:Uncharacterized protein n=1 Tax=Lentinula edodes TaxID=5353 RepID=A0A1Q3DX87_LENED|nr:hypothetical protein LENED_000911 [Lentinula edodes]